MRFTFLLYIAITSFLLLNCSESKNQDTIPVEDFFSDAEKFSFEISPDGNYVAYLALDRHCKNIFLMDLNNPDSSKQLTYQHDLNVKSFNWVNNQEIAFVQERDVPDSLFLYSVNISSEKIKMLMPPVKARMRWVYPIVPNDNSFLVAMNLRDSAVFDLHKIYLDGRPSQLSIPNTLHISSWMISKDGEVRVAVANDSLHQTVLYRKSVQEPFKQVLSIDFENKFSPVGFVENSVSRIYVVSNLNQDKAGVVVYDLETGKEEQQIYLEEKSDVHVDRGYNLYNSKLLFANYGLFRNKRKFFDSRVQRMFEQLQQQLPDADFQVLDVDSAYQKIIVNSYKDDDPGGIYLFDGQKNKLKLLVENNPKLHNKKLAKSEIVHYVARDGMKISGILTYPLGKNKTNLPTVILPHDGPDSREIWGFDEVTQFLANRGYLVFQMNYRGSTGFGKQFWSAGFREWGGKIQDDINDGARWLIKEKIADSNRVAIVGKGFGGYSALNAACFTENLYKCAASYSGYTNFFTYFRDVPPYYRPYMQMMYQLIGDPVREAEKFKSISPVFHSDKVKIPVLLAQGGKDRFSSVTDANQFVQKLKNNHIPVKYYLKDDEGRTFKKEDNIIGYYLELNKFLDKYLN